MEDDAHTRAGCLVYVCCKADHVCLSPWDHPDPCTVCLSPLIAEPASICVSPGPCWGCGQWGSPAGVHRSAVQAFSPSHWAKCSRLLVQNSLCLSNPAHQLFLLLVFILKASLSQHMASLTFHHPGHPCGPLPSQKTARQQQGEPLAPESSCSLPFHSPDSQPWFLIPWIALPFFELDAHGILSYVLDCVWLFHFASRRAIHHVVGRVPCLTSCAGWSAGPLHLSLCDCPCVCPAWYTPMCVLHSAQVCPLQAWMIERINDWMDDWLNDEWTIEWSSGWFDRMGKWMIERMNGRLNGRMDHWMNEWMTKWMNVDLGLEFQVSVFWVSPLVPKSYLTLGRSGLSPGRHRAHLCSGSQQARAICSERSLFWFWKWFPLWDFQLWGRVSLRTLRAVSMEIGRKWFPECWPPQEELLWAILLNFHSSYYHHAFWVRSLILGTNRAVDSRVTQL